MKQAMKLITVEPDSSGAANLVRWRMDITVCRDDLRYNAIIALEKFTQAFVDAAKETIQAPTSAPFVSSGP